MFAERGRKCSLVVGMADRWRNGESIMDEAEFLLAIRRDPNDNSLRLAYASLLAEQGDGIRAAFLRVECQLYPLSPYDPLAVALQQQLARECRTIDIKWVAAVSRSPMYGCVYTGGKRALYHPALGAVGGCRGPSPPPLRLLRQ
jgi:uncharacterized protein (TIGR02996 family)